MTTIERSRAVLASPEAVWDVLAEFDAIAAWAPNVDHSSLLSESSAGVGACRRVQVGRASLTETVTDWDENRRLRYRLDGLPPVLGTVRNEWLLDPHPGFTKVRVRTAIEGADRPLPKVLRRLVGRRLGAASDQMLGGLAAAAGWKERS